MASNNALVILLLGQTGVGKSTLINKAAGEVVSDVGSGLFSCTKDVKPFSMTLKTASNPLQKVILVDTPGFNDTWEGDVQIFLKIRTWLKSFSPEAQKSNIRFAGILYLCDLSHARNVEQGETLITPNNFELPPLVKNLHFVATCCNSTTLDMAQRRERELRENYWGIMLSRGAQASRFENSELSAVNIVANIANITPICFPKVLEEFEAIYSKLPPPSTNPKQIRGGFFARLFSIPVGKRSKS